MIIDDELNRRRILAASWVGLQLEDVLDEAVATETPAKVVEYKGSTLGTHVFQVPPGMIAITVGASPHKKARVTEAVMAEYPTIHPEPASPGGAG